MRDRERVLEVLRQIEEAAGKIISRFQPIQSVNDFTDSPAGMGKIPPLRETIKKIWADII